MLLFGVEVLVLTHQDVGTLADFLGRTGVGAAVELLARSLYDEDGFPGIAGIGICPGLTVKGEFGAVELRVLIGIVGPGLLA